VLVASCANNAEKFPDNFARKVCAKSYACCAENSSALVSSMYSADEEDCRFQVRRIVSSRFLYIDRSLAAGRVEYSDLNATECLSQIENQSCADLVASGIPEICYRVRVAKVPVGGGCCHSTECVSDNCLEDCIAEGDIGVCQAPRPTVGEACSGYCANGLYCGANPTGGFGTCVERSPEGEACKKGEECLSSNCDGGNPFTGTVGSCGPVPAKPVAQCFVPNPTL
jgi:hypothetical protein